MIDAGNNGRSWAFAPPLNKAADRSKFKTRLYSPARPPLSSKTDMANFFETTHASFL